MADVDLEQIVAWPGKGTMTLSEAFARAHTYWQTNDPIAITLHPCGENPPSIVQTIPVTLLH